MTARFDHAVGRYVHLDIAGTAYRVYVEETGPVDGVPILLQHTAGADGRQWRHVLEDDRLRAHWRMFAYDLPFHGKSVPPVGPAWWAEPYRLTRDFAMAVPLALAEAYGLDRPFFMGSSIGGHLAADLARYHPDHFRAVIGLEAAMTTPGGFHDWWYHPRISNDSKASIMYGLTAPSAPEPFRRETAFVYSQGAPPVFKGDLYYYSVDHDLTIEAAAIDTTRCEVHLLTGEYDWASTPEDSAALAAAIDGATYRTMEGLGHFPMSEDPERFLAEIRPVLDGLRARLG